MLKRNVKRKNNLLSRLTTRQEILSSFPHSAPISLFKDGDDPGFTNQKNWSKELIAAASTLQSIAMTSTRVR